MSHKPAYRVIDKRRKPLTQEQADARFVEAVARLGMDRTAAVVFGGPLLAENDA